MKNQCILFLICIFLTPLVYASDIYYIDNVNGKDNNSGKSKAAAWKSLNKVNSFTFKSGDQIYLKNTQRSQKFVELYYCILKTLFLFVNRAAKTIVYHPPLLNSLE